jgi:hypothetical protein
MNEKRLIVSQNTQDTVIFPCLIFKKMKCLLPELELFGLASQSPLITVTRILNDSLFPRQSNVLFPELILRLSLWILPSKIVVFDLIFKLHPLFPVFKGFLIGPLDLALEKFNLIMLEASCGSSGFFSVDNMELRRRQIGDPVIKLLHELLEAYEGPGKQLFKEVPFVVIFRNEHVILLENVVRVDVGSDFKDRPFELFLVQGRILEIVEIVEV